MFDSVRYCEPIHIYIVWYGRWSVSEKDVIRTAILSLTPKHPIQKFPNLASLWKVVMSYYQELPGEPRKYARNTITIAQELDDRSSNKTIDADNDPFNIIQGHVRAGNLAFDPEQGVYFILTAADVAFTANHYCGYHGYNCYDTTQTCAGEPKSTSISTALVNQSSSSRRSAAWPTKAVSLNLKVGLLCNL